MRRRAVLLLPCFASAAAAAAEAPSSPPIDRLRIDPTSGQITLYAVPDERIDNRAAVDRLRRKLNAYARHAKSGRLFVEQPAANRRLPPILAVRVQTPVSDVERQNLEGIKLQYRYTDIVFVIEVVEPGRRVQG